MLTSARTVPELLRRGARELADRQLVGFENGDTWTWADALREGARAANVLAARGIGRGDRVALLLPNGASWLRAWWGTTLLGAVIAPMNTAYRGRLLADVCDTIGPALIVAEAELAGRLAERHRSLVLDPAVLETGAEEIPEPDPPAGAWDTHCLLLTSGTTGPSKASISTHAYLLNQSAFLVETRAVDHDDVFCSDMPWFHLSGFAPAVQMMRVGGRFAVRSMPALTDYWPTAKRLGATFALAPGTISQFLEAQPPADSDRDHSMRFVLSSPLPADPERFRSRFGLSGLYTAYGSTEANICVINDLDTPIRTGSCGRARAGFEIRIVDEHDEELPAGEVGQLIVRADRPWLQSQGYLNDPETTLTVWRNGWFHTGDALRVDQDGYYFFHDRYKDALRRRGENISSHDVERAVLDYDGIAEVACVASPGEIDGEDEVKVFIVPSQGADIEFAEVLAFLVDRMAHFMVPRYYELIDNLPKTPTQRVRKHELRTLGNTVRTWDRYAAGYRVTRTGLVKADLVRATEETGALSQERPGGQTQQAG